MTKLILPDTVVPYDSAKWFEHYNYDVAGVRDLSALLAGLEAHPGFVIIRGQLLDDVDASRPVLRRKDAYDGERAYFRTNPLGHQWMLADFDKLPAPDGLHPDDRIPYLVGLLPPQFRDASFHYQWSSSSGLRDWSLLSCHLFFWMAQARTDVEMIRWAAEQDIDEAVMRTVQPNYVARPIFHHAVADPFAGGGRSGFVTKGRDSVPPFAIPPVPTYQRSRSWQATAPGNEFDGEHPCSRSLAARLDAIGLRLHMPINRAIACAVALYDNALDWCALKARIRERVMAGPHPNKHLYLRDSYLNASYRGAMLKYGGRSQADKMVSEYNWRRTRQN